MRLVHERRRDDQMWILDWLVKQTGRPQNFENNERDFPADVKSYAMIPKHMGKRGLHQEALARAAEAAGHHDTAMESYLNAVRSFQLAQHAIYYDDNPEKLRWYHRLRECYERVIALADYPIETVDVPWEGSQIQCLFHVLPDRRRAPTVLYMPGMDSLKERFPDPRVNLAHRRGMHVMVMDGPGQGMSNVRKIRITHDNYPRAASAVIDYLCTRSEVDKDGIVVCGQSMGSFWAIQTAAYDHRVGAVATAASCLNGKTAIFEQASPRFKRVFMYMAGIHNEDEFDREVASRMTTVGLGRSIRCPVLTIQGEFDPLSPVEDAYAFHEELDVPRELWVEEDDFHTAGGHSGFGGMGDYPFMLDFVKDALAGKYPPGHVRVRSIPAKGGSGPYDPVEG